MKRSAVGYALAALFFVAYLLVQVVPLLGTRGTGIVALASHANDYKHIYLGSRMLADGLSPYNAENMLALAGDYSQRVDPRFRTILPYVYLPFTGFVMRPFSALPFAKSVAAFQIVNHLCILGGLIVAAWAAGWRRDGWSLAVLLAAVAFNTALQRQNNAGQLNAVLFFGMAVLAAGVLRGWHPALVGFIAAFLMLFKLSPGIFLIWFLLRREWTRAAWMIGWALVLTALTVAVYGLKVHLDFLPVLKDMGYGRSTWAEYGNTFWRDPYNQSFNALFHRLFVEYKDSGIVPWAHLSPTAANGMTWAVSLAILAAFAVGSWCKRLDSDAASFAMAVCASLLLPSIMWDHYLVQALLPAVLLAGVYRDRPGVLAALAAGIVIMSLPVALDQPAFCSGPGLLAMSFKTIAVLIPFAAALARTIPAPRVGTYEAGR